jgi:acetolactate synthase-1/3 small subunit
MKKPAKPQDQFIFSICAEDKKGLVGQILVYFNRSSYSVHSLNVSRTDISDLVLITLEAEVPQQVLLPFTERLKKIVEVHAVKSYPAGDGLKKTGFYRLAINALDNKLWLLMTKYGAGLSSVGVESLVICKTGSDKDLAEFYSLLEGPYLMGFCKSGLIVDESLMLFEELSVLNAD